MVHITVQFIRAAGTGGDRNCCSCRRNCGFLAALPAPRSDLAILGAICAIPAECGRSISCKVTAATGRPDTILSAQTMRSLFAFPPSDATLGVPVYPGAIYSAGLSALYSGYGEAAERRYVYEVDATFRDVVDFYEKATGSNACSAPTAALVCQIPLTPAVPLGTDRILTSDRVMVLPGNRSEALCIVVCRCSAGAGAGSPAAQNGKGGAP
jgi:hypothetical protein